MPAMTASQSSSGGGSSSRASATRAPRPSSNDRWATASGRAPRRTLPSRCSARTRSARWARLAATWARGAPTRVRARGGRPSRLRAGAAGRRDGCAGGSPIARERRAPNRGRCRRCGRPPRPNARPVACSRRSALPGVVGVDRTGRQAGGFGDVGDPGAFVALGREHLGGGRDELRLGVRRCDSGLACHGTNEHNGGSVPPPTSGARRAPGWLP